MQGLGDATACGINPCGLWDYVYASDACLAYKLCANPTDPTAILESQGVIAGTGTILGGTAAQTAQNVVTGIFTDPVTGGINVTTLLIAFGIIYFMAKR